MLCFANSTKVFSFKNASCVVFCLFCFVLFCGVSMHIYVSGCRFYRRSLYCHSISLIFLRTISFLGFYFNANLKARLLFAHQSRCGIPYCAKQRIQTLFIVVHFDISAAD